MAQISATLQAQGLRRRGTVIVQEAFREAVSLGKIYKPKCPGQSSGGGEKGDNPREQR